MRFVAVLFIAILMGLIAFGLRSEGASTDPESGEKCPGKFFSCDCRIVDGEYRGLAIGASRRDVFDALCSGRTAVNFRSAQFQADRMAVPKSVIEEFDPLIETYAQNWFPNGSATFFARSTADVCDLKPVEPFISVIAVLSDRIDHPAALSLRFREGLLSEIYLAGHTIDL